MKNDAFFRRALPYNMTSAMLIPTILFIICLLLPQEVSPFSISVATSRYSTLKPCSILRSTYDDDNVGEPSLFDDDTSQHQQHQYHSPTMAQTTRRSILQQSLLATIATASSSSSSSILTTSTTANAAVGSLPEFSDTNAILQSITIDVTDKTQYDETIAFFVNGFEMKILRQRNNDGGGVKDTVRKKNWFGFSVYKKCNLFLTVC